MTDERAGGNGFAADPERLDRAALVDLVRRLQVAVARQQRTIERQRELLRAAGVEDEAAERGDTDAGPPARRPMTPGVPRWPFPPVAGADLTLVFDGGAIGNPGKGYGSFQIVEPMGAVVAAERLQFGDGITNNGAEFRALIAGLERAVSLAGERAGRQTIAVRGDSQLVINGIAGTWRVRHPDLVPLHERAQRLLSAFGKTDVAWHGRARSVRALGH